MLVAVVVVVVVVVNVVRGQVPGDEVGGPAQVSGESTSPRQELPPVEVTTPPVTPEADAGCPALMSSLPQELAGLDSRRVQSGSPYAYAWGDPAVVLVCGVPTPPGLQADSFLVDINGVTWFVDLSDPEAYVYTSVDRALLVEVRVPASRDSATVAALGPLIDAAVPLAAD